MRDIKDVVEEAEREAEKEIRALSESVTERKRKKEV